MRDLQTWILQAKWLYSNCIAMIGGSLECYKAYSLGGLLAICALAVFVLVFARRSFRAWREERINEDALLAQKQVAPPEVMEQFKWEGDGAGGVDLSYQELVTRIKEEKSRLKGKG